jgi:hypothetical protein
MAKLTEAQQKRAEARERRRTSSPASEKPSDASTEENGANDEQPLDAVKHAAKVAAAGAAVGAAAAAARVLTRSEDDEGSEPEAKADQEPQESQEPRAEQPESSDENADEQSPPVAEHRSEDERRGATPDDARTTVQRAREQLEALLERPVESVSSFERTHDGWLVTMEVVEVSRIPESTDVLASYELELDEERNLRRYARVRRYNRSQANLGDHS